MTHGLCHICAGQTVPPWLPNPPPLPPPRGDVIRVGTSDQLLAAVDRLSRGGTILLADGQYKLPRPVVLDQKQNVVLRSAGGDASKVTLVGKGWERGDQHDDILRISRCEGVTIADLSFADCRSYGIKVEAEHAPKDVHILNCRFRDIGVRAIKGSAAQNSDLRAVRGSVRGCYFENTKTPPAEWLFGGDYIAAIDMMALEDWTFSENVFRNIKGRNGGGRAAIFIWVRSRNVIVERNLIVNCDRGVAFGNPGKSTANLEGERLVYVSGGIIRNNFIAGGPDCGIELWHADRIKVLNNTIWRPERNWNRGIRIGTGTTNTEVANNLVHGGIQSEGGEATVHHNLSGRLEGYFEDAATGNLALTPRATGALGRGIPILDVTEDIRGMARSGTPDLGAWESEKEPNFTSGSATARKFGTHEIILTGQGNASNPFDTIVTVTFTPPSGVSNAVTVDAFYDGGNTWRARVYVSEAGRWEWDSTSATAPSLDGKSGSFMAMESNLRGLLRAHKANPRAWMTDDGRWFANISDTGYRLFHAEAAPLWQEFIRDSAAKGITCMRAAALGGWGGTPAARVDDNNTWVWNDPWAGGAKPDYTRFDLAKFQTTDSRLVWILDHYPEMYLQMILFGLKGYGSEGTGDHWASLPESVRTKTMRYFIARWAAFPNVFWLIVNDMHCNEKFPRNRAFVRDVGKYFAAHDPWKHLISTGPNRRAGFPFTTPEDLKWCSYIFIEDANAVGADQITQHQFDRIPLHVWMGEDYYEQDRDHYADPRFFFRWLFWSWLMSGGSANYGGRWGPIHPYAMTGNTDLPWQGIDGKTTYTGEQLVGLDSIPFLAGYFRDRNLDLGPFKPNDDRVTDLDRRQGRLRPKLMERGKSEFLVYHPNALADGKAARVDPAKTAATRIDLRDAPGRFQVEWFRADDGVATKGNTVEGGSEREFTAPWQGGQDVVLRLLKAELSSSRPMVYGWFPAHFGSWKTDGIDWDCLTHLCFRSVELEADGKVRRVSGNPPRDFVETAHRHGVKLTVLVWTKSKADSDSYLARFPQEAANNLLAYVKENNLDGVNIDDEQMGATNAVAQVPNRELVTRFFQILSKTFKAANPDYHITFAAPPVIDAKDRFGTSWLDLKGIAEVVDGIIPMGYTQNPLSAGWTTNPEPLGGGGRAAWTTTRDIQTMVKDYLDAMGGHKEKLLVGISLKFGGYEWRCRTDQRLAPVLDKGTWRSLEECEAKARKHGARWDERQKSSWYCFPDGDAFVQGWFNDARAWRAKLDWIREQGLGGLGIWVLDGVNDPPAAWELLHRYSSLRPNDSP